MLFAPFLTQSLRCRRSGRFNDGMDNTQIESRGVTDPGTMGSLLVFVNLIGFFAFALSLDFAPVCTKSGQQVFCS